jgi:hypothetical protein
MLKGLKKQIKLEDIKEHIVEDVRKSRGKEQKIFLILTHEYDDVINERKYEVMGTTGNVYTVSIINSPTCTCPDFLTRGKRCKHIYFILTRIMKVEKIHEDIQTYTDKELIHMFKNIPQITENLRVDKSKLERYNQLKKNNNGEVDMRPITEDSECPICLLNLEDERLDELTYCKYSCGYMVHTQCFDMYNTKRIGNIKCIFCQSPWIKETQYTKL